MYRFRIIGTVAGCKYDASRLEINVLTSCQASTCTGVVWTCKSKFKIPIYLHLPRLRGQAQHFRPLLAAILRPVDRAQLSSSSPDNVVHTFRGKVHTYVPEHTYVNLLVPN